MKKILALIMALVMVFALAACGAEKAPEASDNAGGEPTEASLSDKIMASVDNPVDTTKVKEAVDTGDFKIGVILLHNEQIGYDFAHISGIKEAAKALNVAEDQIIWKYDVPEDENCYEAAVDLAEQGCDIIFADSFGHESYMMQAAGEYPEILFCHASGQSAATSDLPNFVNYFTKIFESRYVSGVVAGMKLKELMDAGTVTDAHVGYVGAYPYAEVVSGYTAFFLGVQSIVPEAYMDVTFTNSWADMTAEAQAADALIAKGCVIISQHADTTGAPSAVEAALASGKTVYCVGYNVDMLSVAPNAALTSAQNNWGKAYEAIIGAAMKGEPVARNTALGYEADGVQISELGKSCAAGTAEKVAEIEAGLKDGSIHVFDTSKWTIDGKNLDSYTTSYGFDGLELVKDGYFHESEYMSAPLFDAQIDGITKLN